MRDVSPTIRSTHHRRRFGVAALAGMLAVVATGAWVGSPASAEVARRDDSGFELRLVREVRAEPAAAYGAAVRDLGRWWDPAHTYSGRAANLRLDPRPGGCFCERLAGRGGVEHLRVVYVVPGQAVRMLGGLGPLQELAAGGALTWTFERLDAGGTRIGWTYRVTGLDAAASKNLAPVVDQVMAQQIERLGRFIDSGKPAAGQTATGKP